MTNKEFESVGDGNIVQEYGDIGIQFLNVGISYTTIWFHSR